MSLDSCDCVFHGIGYNLTITVTHGSTNSSSSSSSSSTTQFQDSNNGSSSSSSSSLSSEPTLFVDLEELSTSSSWHGEFSSSYVENITRKTGSFKRFDVLVKMLVGALQARTETVFLDLLTYADLEALRVRKAGGQSSAIPNASTPARTVTVATNTKRYLILTYVAEFDRIHYPLPLLFEEVPTVSSLSRLVRRLRSEVLSFRSLAGLAAQAPALIAGGLPASNIESLSSSVQGLQRENSLLRQMLTEQQGKVNEEKDSVNTLKAQITSLHEVNKVGEAAIERLRNASKTEVKKLRSEIAELQSRLGNGNGPLSSSSSSSSSGNVLVESGDDSNTRGSSSSTSAIISSASNDMLVQLKESNDALSKRVQELTKQLALTKGSSATSGLGTAVQRGRTLQTRTGVSNGGGATSRSPAVASRSPAMSSSTRLSTSTSKQQVSSTLSTSKQQRGRSSSVGSAGSVKRSNSNASATSKGVSSQNRRTPTPVRNTITSTLSQGQGGVGRSSSNTTPTSIGSGTSAGPRPGSRAYYNAKVAAARASPSGSSRLVGGTNTPPPPPISAGVSLELTNPTAGKSNGATQSTSSASPIGTQSNVLSSKLSAQIGGETRGGGGRSTSRGSAGKAAASLSQSPYLTSIGPMLQTLERGPAGRKSATPTREITGLGRGISTAPSGSRSNSTGKGRGGESQNEPPITHSSSLSSSSNLVTQKPLSGTVTSVVTQPVTAILEPPAVPRTAWVASVADNSSSSTTTTVPAVVVHSPSSSKYEASSEIQDIDARLAQLQDFLRAAKNGDPLPSL